MTASGATVAISTLLLAPRLAAQAPDEPVPAPVEETDDDDCEEFWSKEDGWLDVSGFLDQKYGFLPIVLPITEPAVGYGAAVGLAFISSPLGAVKDGYDRPNISLVGGMATENGTRGLVLGDFRHWMDDNLQTVAGVFDASVNLDFHGIGDDSRLDHDPLEYTLEPLGTLLQAKYRIAGSRWWAGLSYAFARTNVEFDAPAGTPGLPDFEKETNEAGLTPTLTYDSRDNLFTPNRGTYVEAGCGFFSSALGGDDEFEKARVIAMHFIPISETLFFGLRGEAAATFNDPPFYMRPFITLRGAPVMRYQGEEIAQLEAELRWQFWQRFSLIGFGGVGAAWTDVEQLDSTQVIYTGGGGFRYELARDYGLHAGADVAFSRDNAAVYIQIGGAWTRP